jgi:undecaprenyl diphosphate synthase
VRAAIELGIEYITIYSFSSENWRRPIEEVAYLMSLLKRFIRNDLAELHQNGVRVRILGERAGLTPDIESLLVEAEALTRENKKLTLVVAFNYGSRQEIAAAARRLATRVASGELDPVEINEAALESELGTRGVPDPDLIIRTSGEQRLSNFLMWQAAYAELVFLPVLWPDFDRSSLEQALREYAARERRFGGVIPANAKTAS